MPLPLRNWQQEALKKIVSQWETPNSRPLIAACPGSGKTRLAVVATHSAMKEFGVQVALVVCPTVNIRCQWADAFEEANLSSYGRRGHECTNEALRFRLTNQLEILAKGGSTAFCITYQQAAKDAELFTEIASRYKLLLIADEVHHADDNRTFGAMLTQVAEKAHLRLALSGTPFNTNGGSLAMCESVEAVDDEGQPIRRTLPLHSYTYRQAIEAADHVCRPVEFLKVLGRATATFKSLSNDETYQHIVDLAHQNKTDRISLLVEPGDFFTKMAQEALRYLHSMQQTDNRAAMLVVTKDVSHGKRIAAVLKQMCRENPEWSNLSLQEMYHDTPGVHDRIQQLNSDATDIVVTVKIISEGIDVKRLRVGLYASDCLTRLFFIQFIGRFVRYEDRLTKSTNSQFCQVVIPAHAELLKYAREIEIMVDSAVMATESEEDGGEMATRESVKTLFGVESEVTGEGLIYRGDGQDERLSVRAFFEKFPEYQGVVPDTFAIHMARELGLSGAAHPIEIKPKIDWRTRNMQMVRAIVRVMKMNGETDERDYAKVNQYANSAVGIRKLDPMTPDDVLQQRHQVLNGWFRAMRDDGKAWSDLHG